LLYLFEDYALDTDRRELRRGAGLVAVEPQVFDLLEHLIRNRERVVSKDDLLASVWSGRVVSESALTSRINAARSAIGDSGEAQRLIKTIPRKGIRFVGAAREEQRSAEPSPTAFAAEQPSLTLPFPDRPSIAVLPFQNMSGDPEQEYFADGMAEEIITALSRMHWLFVIARNSSFTYKGRPVDVKKVGRDLGVRYVLEGGVRRSANRVRITAQLIDASTGGHLWADRFDGASDDIFDLQDQVTVSVVGAIAPKLEQAEIKRAKHKPTGSLDAYDYFLRGLASFYQGSREALSEGLRLFNKAIDLDPDFASAHGMAAWCYVRRKASGWLTDPEKEIAEAGCLARRAVDLGRDDAVALCTGGFALAYIDHDLEAGALFIDRALVLNPNLATAWLASSFLRVWMGEPDVAIEHVAKFKRMSPLDPNIALALSASAFAHFFAERYDEASCQAEQVLQEGQNLQHQGLRISAVSNALAGRIERAEKAMARLRHIDPALRVSNLADLTPLRRPQDMAKYAEGMRKAGLPE
jgi:TolB-like protein/tetratricopeptide (TPR) repeat protein